jgi:hypothetical protein
MHYRPLASSEPFAFVAASYSRLHANGLGVDNQSLNNIYLVAVTGPFMESRYAFCLAQSEEPNVTVTIGFGDNNARGLWI